MGHKGHAYLYMRLRSVNTGEWLAPPELRERLVELAKDQGSSLTDIVVGILADRFKVDVDTATVATDPQGDKDHLVVRLPWKLDTALAVAGTRLTPKGNRQRVAMIALCDHFGLEVPPPPRRGRVPRA